MIFNRLPLILTKVLIFWYFDLKYYIWIETDISNYAINGVLNQLISKSNSIKVVFKTDLGQWLLIAFFSRKIILAKIQYKTYDGELLAIIKAFKIWRHYLKRCKYKVLILTNYNNFYHFIDIKNLSFKQVC